MSSEPDKKLYNRFHEHIALTRHVRLKADANATEHEQHLQPTMTGALVHQRDREKQAESIIHELVRALRHDKISSELADGELGGFV